MRVLLCILFLFILGSAEAQNGRYLVYFSDKQQNEFSITRADQFLSERALLRRAKNNTALTLRDLPVTQIYIDQVDSISTVHQQSKWLNAVVINTENSTERDAIRALPFVDSIAYIGTPFPGKKQQSKNLGKLDTRFPLVLSPTDYGASQFQIRQLSTQRLHHLGWHGQGVLIAVMDNGFRGLDASTRIEELHNKVIDQWDFVHGEAQVYNDGSHGTSVVSTMMSSDTGQLFGHAPLAQYALYVTEDNANELRYEELNWLLAAERADSLGADIINTSLGYSTFDDPVFNYAPHQMDGRSTLITRAANIAHSVGMLVVVSAGNEGNDPWQIVTAPGDAPNAITVGALNTNYERAAFSGLSAFDEDGQTVDKPEVYATGAGTAVMDDLDNIYNGNGTSFSSPQICAGLAVIMSAFPQIPTADITEVFLHEVRLPGKLGHGRYPNFYNIYTALLGHDILNADASSLQLRFNNPAQDQMDYTLLGYPHSSAQMRVHDALGRQIVSHEFEVGHLDRLAGHIDTRDWPEGSYFLSLWHADELILQEQFQILR